MKVQKIVFDDYVICPLCKKKMGSLSGPHLYHKHGLNMREFKMKYGIPMGVALIAHNSRRKMQEKGKRRSQWFKKNVMPIGVQYSREKGDIVPPELRKHGGATRRGKTWIKDFVKERKKEGWLDLHEAAQELAISYNYARKCATDGRLKTETMKGIRFTKKEWVEEAKALLQENRKKYRPDLLTD